MGAVSEAAGDAFEFGEVIDEFFLGELEEAESPHPGSIDDLGAVAEVPEVAAGCGVGSTSVALAEGARIESEVRFEGVEEGAFSDSAMPNECGSLPFELFSKFLQAELCGGGDPDDRSETTVRVEDIELFVVGAQEIGFVDGDHRLGTATLDGDQVTINHSRVEGWCFDADHDDDDIDIRDDHPLAIIRAWVRAREFGLAGLD